MNKLLKNRKKQDKLLTVSILSRNLSWRLRRLARSFSQNKNLLLCLPAVHDCLAMLGLRIMARPADLNASMSVFKSAKARWSQGLGKICGPACWWRKQNDGAFLCGQKCRYLRAQHTWAGPAESHESNVHVTWEYFKHPSVSIVSVAMQ